MAKRNHIIVTPPKLILWLSLFLIGVFAVILAIEYWNTKEMFTVKLVLVAIFVFIPCGLSALWAGTFRVQVEGATIRVCRFFGLVRYSFDVSAIDKIVVKTTQSRMQVNEKITIYTTKRKKVSVESVMENSGKVIRFLEANVDAQKFHRSVKVFR